MSAFNYPNHDGWQPRDYQKPAWDYLAGGGKQAELIWHRRAGKDDIALRHAGCEMLTTPANYWHMLPQSNQVRKAIWEAVNPHTGKRRIHEAFPKELFEYRETDMMVKCKVNASTWQCLGSDNYQGAIGSTPKGIVYSEWALADPTVRGYLRPIIRENNGWQCFITTPRGKNHAYRTFTGAQKNDKAFAQLLTIHDTGVLTPSQLMEELIDYKDTYGEDQGLALFEQEYECSFDAAIMGAYFGAEFKHIDRDGRISNAQHNPKYPVYVAMDIGRSDDTAMWFFQYYQGHVFVIDYYANNFKDPDHYMGVIKGRDCHIDIVDKRVEVKWGDLNNFDYHSEWDIKRIYLPHDGAAKSFATMKSAEEQFAAAFGWKSVKIVPRLSFQDGIQATRKILGKTVFNGTRCELGIEALRSYGREWDGERRIFKSTPVHNWASHPSDGFRYLAIVCAEDRIAEEKATPRYDTDRTFNELLAMNKKSRLAKSKHR